MHEPLEEYLEILQAQDKAEGTLLRYEGSLNAFSEWLQEEDISPYEVSKRDLQRYLAWLKNDREYAPKTIHGYFSPVSGFYQDLESSGEIETDPSEDVSASNYADKVTKTEKVTKEKRSWLETEEVTQLVDNVPAPNLRNRLLVLFMYYTGLRRQEVSDVRIDDLDREDRRVNVRGKGDKVHTAHWQPQLDTLLTRWLDMGKRDASPYANESPYLFVSDSAEKVSGDRITKVVRKAAENAGLQEVLYEDASGRNRYKITSHTLRHSYAVHWIENGGSIEALSKSMAHDSVTTTEIYAEILDKRAKEEYEKFGPKLDL
jgi:integrase/recombinase XerD